MKIMNKFEKEYTVELLTKYINKCLMKDVRVKEWGFSVTLDGHYSLNVQIDYINDFHSRDMILIRDDHKLDKDTIEELRAYFDWCLNRHFDELKEKVKNEERIF